MTVTTIASDWPAQASRKFADDLMVLTANWYGARLAGTKVLQHVHTCLEWLDRHLPDCSRPQIWPTPSGQVQLTWEKGQQCLVVDLEEDAVTSFYYPNGQGQSGRAVTYENVPPESVFEAIFFKHVELLLK